MTILRPGATVAAAIVVLAPASFAMQNASADGPWTKAIEPSRIIQNVYYVGTEDLASYLVTSSQGHVLIDSGVAANAATIAAGIQKLGFKLEDVKYLLTTQAHFDHVAAHAELQKRTGAQVVASDGDAPLLETGGKADYHFGADYNFAAVKVDRRVKQGDTISIGDRAITAHMTPGHTQGTTTWVMPVKQETGETLNVVFVGSTSVNPGVKLVANAKYPQIADDYAASFARLKALKVDVFLTAHLSANEGLEKMAKLRAGATPNPFVDAAGFRAYLERSQANFEAELAKQRSGGQLLIW
nr:BJP_beta_lactamase [uncultured bacterium]